MVSMTRPQIADILVRNGGDPNVLTVVGIRGAKGPNKRGEYDDEIYLISPTVFRGFKGNTDPSRVRKGSGTGANKGMAVLQPGLWHAHGFGLHRGKYRALIQIKGQVTVMRDGDPPYPDRGYFGINIHNGSWNSTSSLGCQTLHPSEWPTFIAMADAEAKRLRQTTIPYLLWDKSLSATPSHPNVRQSGTVNIGSVGPRVIALQRALNAALGLALKEDGDFGERTDAAVRDFQIKRGLTVDGLAGPKTFAALGL